MNFIHNMRAAFSAAAMSDEDKDRGNLVETVIITAGFAIAGFLLVNWISSALLNKGADIASCIEGSSAFDTAASSANCTTQNHAEGNSFKDDSGYKGRFG